MPSKKLKKSLAEHSSSILSIDPEPLVGQCWRSHKCHRLFCGWLKYICVMFWRFVFRDFWCGGVSKPMPVWWSLPQTWLIFMSFLQDKTASSTFQVPVWSLGMQLETKGSLEFLKSKCWVIFEASSAHDNLLIGNGHGDTEE